MRKEALSAAGVSRDTRVAVAGTPSGHPFRNTTYFQFPFYFQNPNPDFVFGSPQFLKHRGSFAKCVSVFVAVRVSMWVRASAREQTSPLSFHFPVRLPRENPRIQTVRELFQGLAPFLPNLGRTPGFGGTILSVSAEGGVSVGPSCQSC